MSGVFIPIFRNLTSDKSTFQGRALAWISARSSATIPIPDFKTAKQV
jgi:hypothetical protein